MASGPWRAATPGETAIYQDMSVYRGRPHQGLVCKRSVNCVPSSRSGNETTFTVGTRSAAVRGYDRAGFTYRSAAEPGVQNGRQSIEKHRESSPVDAPAERGVRGRECRGS